MPTIVLTGVEHAAITASSKTDFPALRARTPAPSARKSRPADGVFLLVKEIGRSFWKLNQKREPLELVQFQQQVVEAPNPKAELDRLRPLYREKLKRRSTPPLH
jgi:hypothetical protein